MIHHMQMTADGVSNLLAAFRNADQITPVYLGYRVEKDTMYLYVYKPRQEFKEVHYFPFAMKSELAAQFVWNWIEETTPKANKPHTDGTVRKAFEFTTEQMAILDDYYAVVKVRILWQVIGK